MAAGMVNLATSEKLQEMDWMKNIEICELVAHDPGKAKDVMKAVKKRLKNKNGKIQLLSVKLLEMLIDNCGEYVHKQVVDNEILPILVKIVKKQADLPVCEKIFLLLHATQTAVRGASGRFPQYYNAYCDLVSSGVQFYQQPSVKLPEGPVPKMEAKNLPSQESHALRHETDEKQSTIEVISDSSIINKASSVLEILREVLNALDPEHPVGVADEFVLDLVEQCSFQKQQIMHLVLTSVDEKVVKQAILLNEQLHMALTRHDALLYVFAISQNARANEKVNEEDEDRLYCRMRKGKASVEELSDPSIGFFRSIPEDKFRRPLIRPLSIEPSDCDDRPRPQYLQPSDPQIRRHPVVSIPPPPVKHMERDKFFKDKYNDGPNLAGHMRGLSLYSSAGSSSNSGDSTDFSDRDFFGL